MIESAWPSFNNLIAVSRLSVGMKAMSENDLTASSAKLLLVSSGKIIFIGIL